ncbi:hypothetical protein ACFWRV_14530 [Streptomyces sp. NPDC058576]|uniref:effector-associated constant component EACC1 n=1 Tax=Streptomyces sp. NPDC058576 TaxID=3346547 RepID=UPI0036644E90
MLMPTGITVAGEGPNGAHELRRWLSAEPQLRGRIRSGATHAEPTPGAMGIAADALLAVLAPGGVAAVFAGAVVAWAQTRRGSQTITMIRPDGTEITISTTQVRGLDAQQTNDLARQLAADLVGAGRPDDAGGAPDADVRAVGPGPDADVRAVGQGPDADVRAVGQGPDAEGDVPIADTRTGSRTPPGSGGHVSVAQAEPGRPVAPRDGAPSSP